MTDQQKCMQNRLSELYVSYRQRYVLCLPGGQIVIPKEKTGTYCKLTGGVLLNHQDCKYAVGVFAGKWGSRFMCFDVDNGERETVFQILNELEATGIPRHMIHVSYSGGKGYHVELFCKEIVSTDQWHRLYLHVIRSGELDPHQVEFRPTYTQAIKLPLSRHARTGNVCWYVDRDTLEPTRRTGYLFEIEQLRPEDVPDLPLPENPSKKAGDGKGRELSASNAPSLGMKICAPGTRHNMLRNMAVYQRIHGVCQEECEKTLIQWYNCQDHDLVKTDYEGAIQDIRKIVRWVYSERFSVSWYQAADKTSLCTTQMRLVLEQPNRTCRRLVFLLLVRCRMLRPRMSMEDMSKVIGISRVSISKAMKRLSKAGVITFEEGRRMVTEQHGFQAESRKYCVPHEAGAQDEKRITVSMRDLIFDFDRCYYQAMHHLLPQETIKNTLDKQEWNEYLDSMKGASE